MNTNLTVKKSGDSNYIPVRYRVVEMTVGSTAAATYCVICCDRVGWDTADHYNAWKATVSDSEMNFVYGRVTTGMQGSLGAFEVIGLDGLVQYNAQTPNKDM